MSRPLYLVQQTDATGHWRTQLTTTRRRLAIAKGRCYATPPPGARRRVMTRVYAVQEMPCYIAGWINQYAAWGEAFR